MIVKDKNNKTICIINEETEEVIMKYKGLKTEYLLPVGLSIKVERNKTITYIYHKSQNEYEITFR